MRKHVTADRLMQLRLRWKRLSNTYSVLASYRTDGEFHPCKAKAERLASRAADAYFGAELAPTTITPLIIMDGLA